MQSDHIDNPQTRSEVQELCDRLEREFLIPENLMHLTELLQAPRSMSSTLDTKSTLPTTTEVDRGPSPPKEK